MPITGKRNGALVDVPPDELRTGDLDQTAIPRIARDEALLAVVGKPVHSISTQHELPLAGACDRSATASQSVPLVVGSPLHWTLEEHTPTEGQLGSVECFDDILAALDAQFAGAIHADSHLRAHEAWLLGIPGVTPGRPRDLLAEVPELSTKPA